MKAPIIGVLEAALLVEAGWGVTSKSQKQSDIPFFIDSLWVMHCSEEEIIKRLHDRNGLTREQALSRIATQMKTEEKVSLATVAVDTSGPKEKTCEILNEHWNQLLDEIQHASK